MYKRQLWLRGVAFSDATHGWAVGELGAILATTDGGATWSKQGSRTTADLTDVAAGDSSRVWAVSASEMILATTDGGSTWGAQSPAGERFLEGVDFIDATHGWAVGGAILATADGGGPTVKPGYKMTPPEVPSRVHAGAVNRFEGEVWPALPAGGRVKILWEHFLGGHWDTVPMNPEVTLAPYAGASEYEVRVKLTSGKWRVHATAMAGNEVLATSAVRKFTAD